MESIDPLNIIFAATEGRFRRGEGYLACDNCMGYYELERGESSEDFCERCECGGDLRFIPLIEGNSHTHDQIVYHINTGQSGNEIRYETMEKEKQKIIEINKTFGKFKRPMELPLGHIFVTIFFIVLFVVLGIFGLAMGFDHLIVITDF